jgi:hypothetical protein
MLPLAYYDEYLWYTFDYGRAMASAEKWRSLVDTREMNDSSEVNISVVWGIEHERETGGWPKQLPVPHAGGKGEAREEGIGGTPPSSFFHFCLPCGVKLRRLHLTALVGLQMNFPAVVKRKKNKPDKATWSPSPLWKIGSPCSPSKRSKLQLLV